MPKLFKYKKTNWIIISIFFVIVVVGGIKSKTLINPNQLPDLTKIEYRTDVEPLAKRFGKMLIIESCFWKSDTISKNNLGPSSYWIKGYAFIDQENANYLKSTYSFTDIDINFQKGISPDITGKCDFKWSYNKDLSREIAGTGFIGEFYFDTQNNIFYFDLESN